MPNLFDNTLQQIASVEDWGDHSRVVVGDGRIVRRFTGPRHKERAGEWAEAFSAGHRFAQEEERPA